MTQKVEILRPSSVTFAFLARQPSPGGTFGRESVAGVFVVVVVVVGVALEHISMV